MDPREPSMSKTTCVSGIPMASDVRALVPGMSYESFMALIVNRITASANAGRQSCNIMSGDIKGSFVADYVKGGGDESHVSRLCKALRAKGYVIVPHAADYRDQRDQAPAYISISW